MTEHQNQTGLNTSMEPNQFGSRIDNDTIPAMVMSVFIILVNSCVILLISWCSYLKTTSNLILASLAVSDFLMGLVGIPLVVACSSTFISPICVSTSTFLQVISISTVGHITLMTFDRFIYIQLALRYREIMTRARVVIVLCVIWFVSCVDSLVRLRWTVSVQIENAKEFLERQKKNEMIYFSFNFVAFFLLPLVVMIILDAHMLLVLRRQCNRIRRENLPAAFIKHENKLQRRQKRAVCTCILLLVLYIMFWLPYFILEFAQHATEDPLGLSLEASLTIYYLRFCTSLVNPIIYTLRKHDLRRAIKGIARSKLCSCLPQMGSENGTEHVPLSSRTAV